MSRKTDFIKVLKRYGSDISYRLLDKNGTYTEAVSTKAFIQPLRYKNKMYIGNSYLQPGELDGGHYLYMGEIYGPNIPIYDGGELMGFWSPPHKTPTGRKLKYSTFRHPLATDHWDQAMMTARKDELTAAYTKYLKEGGHDKT